MSSKTTASAVTTRVPKPPVKRASVVFIDTQLPNAAPAFNHPGVRYDRATDEYVPVLSRRSTGQDGHGQIPGRAALPETEAMKFWSLVFPDSMEKLKDGYAEPEGRGESGYSIRADKDWNSVRLKLIKAREEYSSPEEEEVGKKSKKTIFQRFLKKSYRKTADNSEQLKVIAKIGERIEYVSPVLAVVDILLDAASKASEVREHVLETFSLANIEDNFGDIEFFLFTFPDDGIIKERSIELVTSIFKGIEDAIGFFISSCLSRAGKAVLKGSHYQKELLESIKKIYEYSDKLLKEGQKSDMYSSKAAHQIIIAHMIQLLEAVSLNSDKLDETSRKFVDQANELSKRTTALMFNGLKRLLDDAEEKELRKIEAREKRFEQRMEEKEKRMEERERRMEEAERERERRERRREKREKKREEMERKKLQMLGSIQDEMRRRNTPSPLFFHPGGPIQPFARPLSAGQDMAAFSQNPPVLWAPQPQMQSQLVPSMWMLAPPQQQQLQQPQAPTSTSILDILNMPALEETDFRYVLDKRYQMDNRSRAHAESALLSKKFRKWLTKPKSMELLIQGDEESNGDEVSGVSLLSATLFHALATRERYIRLAFFCGQHTEADDGFVGGEAMVKSFMAQLLRQHEFDLTTLHENGIDLEQIRKAKVKDLCKLLSWLVGQLPQDSKVVYIIDQIGKYENDEHERKMLTVMKTILRQVHDSGIACTVKVMATSDGATDAVCDVFRDDDDCQLDLGGLECPELEEYSSESRLPVDENDDSESDTTSDSEASHGE